MTTDDRWTKVDAWRVRELRKRMAPLVEAEQSGGCPERQAKIDLYQTGYDLLMAKYHRCTTKAAARAAS